MFSERDQYWMARAFELAQEAGAAGEVPVGALLVLDDNLIGVGANRPIGLCDPSAHAEILALRAGAHAINNYRLLNTTLYVTLEPCLMCVGAIVHARVGRVVFGAFDTKAGAVESVFQLGGTDRLNHRVVYEGGLMAEKCGEILSEFFRTRRKGG